MPPQAWPSAASSNLFCVQGQCHSATVIRGHSHGGWHFLYRLPEGVEAHRGKLAPGIDIKAAGGYHVALPSIHPNGQRYEVEKGRYPAPAPSWLLEELTRKVDEPPALAVDFQERRAVPLVYRLERHDDPVFGNDVRVHARTHVRTRQGACEARVTPTVQADRIDTAVRCWEERADLGILDPRDRARRDLRRIDEAECVVDAEREGGHHEPENPHEDGEPYFAVLHQPQRAHAAAAHDRADGHDPYAAPAPTSYGDLASDLFLRDSTCPVRLEIRCVESLRCERSLTSIPINPPRGACCSSDIPRSKSVVATECRKRCG